ncbi:GIY-YIG nuclease family protein [Rossellomorea marisflavi]|uniref:GIY-YIG nuclease family protein n=1 Tax=Rossellomorea marisflavi TaxID=189381 RepID=A0A5D4S3R2_9BACI|nr:GIY-YIG nuclease family protein [Rossellomorea marisflavi]TYS56396.1 GIY-YIG nuclease family protein [Rossellomorea marisflavi]
MNQWNHYLSLKELKNHNFKIDKYSGYVYLVQYGNFVKIGKTINPIQRISSINGLAVNYAGENVKEIIISDRHSNYSENERKLHSYFNEHRINKGELFRLSLTNIRNTLPLLELKLEKSIISADQGVELRNKILDRYFFRRKIESVNFYNEKLVNVEYVLASKYSKLLEDTLGFEINTNYEDDASDFDFVRLILSCDLLIQITEIHEDEAYVSSILSSCLENINANAILILKKYKQM